MIKQPTPPAFNITAGYAFLAHYRERAAQRGVASVAAQMRKQGFPLWLALATLVPRSRHVYPAYTLAQLTA